MNAFLVHLFNGCVMHILSYSALLGAEGFWISWAAAELLACAVSAAFLIKYRKRYEYL